MPTARPKPSQATPSTSLDALAGDVLGALMSSPPKSNTLDGPGRNQATRTDDALKPPPQTFKRGVGRVEPIRAIRVRGAREHNLKGVDIDIPRDVLTVMTGLSGSGKSSLAFDTIFAEGQRKYMESLSAYARQFLEQLRKPDVESIEGLTPTIAIEQRAAAKNPRSTVATTTEIYDYLRLLFARAGAPRCWHPESTAKDGTITRRCGLPIQKSDPQHIGDHVMKQHAGAKMVVLAPVVRGKKGFHKEVLEELGGKGFARARVNGAIVDIAETLAKGGDNPLGLGRYEKHDVEAVVDRIVVKSDARARLTSSVETALATGGGVVIVAVAGDDDTWIDSIYSEHWACALHPDVALDELEPRLFSFNSHFGACSTCQGLGELYEFSPELVLPDDALALEHGGIAPWKGSGPAGIFSGPLIRRFVRDFKLSRTTTVGELDAARRRILLHGTTPDDVTRFGASWSGVIPMLTDWLERTESEWAKEFLPQFQASRPCGECHGARLNIKALSVAIPTSVAPPASLLAARKRHGLDASPAWLNIADFTHMTIETAVDQVAALVLTHEQQAIAAPILKEVRARLGFLASVGLEYLSLDRKTLSLSGGEAQRIRLASQVGSGIVGATYVLDEPTIGLHSRDNTRLINTLRHLADIGNTVLVVEHDEEMIRAADHVVDVGPGPGIHGGRIVAQGTVEDIAAHPTSITGLYLSGRRQVETPHPSERRPLSEARALTVRGARHNNLKGIDVAVPLGGLVCVTGVSGSGKSTLVNDILLRVAEVHVGRRGVVPGEHDRVEGLDAVDRLVEVDQDPIGRTPRSNPATYTGIFDEIRKLFAKTPAAKVRGYEAGRFSFNVKGGRCEGCAGQGQKKITMHFLPDVHVTCEVCGGTRFNRDTLAITFKDKNIADVLGMTVEDACSYFDVQPKIRNMVECLRDVGLGYITLGQPSTTLSGGEAQRVKLATELGKGASSRRMASEHTLFVLDEPTTGLHFEDVRKLIEVLQRLVGQSNSVLVIEHNLDVVKCADWLIDLGPEGGAHGGRLVATGTPEQVAGVEASHTGRYLKPLLHPHHVTPVAKPTTTPTTPPTPKALTTDAAAPAKPRGRPRKGVSTS